MFVVHKHLSAWAMVLAFLLSGAVCGAESLQCPQADGKLTWLVNNWPPYMITGGQHKQRGMIDLQVNH